MLRRLGIETEANDASVGRDQEDARDKRRENARYPKMTTTGEGQRWLFNRSNIYHCMNGSKNQERQTL